MRTIQIAWIFMGLFSSISAFSTETEEKTTELLDIVWVVDNSGDMEERKYHTNLLQSVEKAFMQELLDKAKADINWRMRLLPTEEYHPNPRFGPSTNPCDYVSSASFNPMKRFTSLIMELGYNGSSGDEQAFAPIKDALSKCHNFLRKNSKLVFIVISTEDEQGRESVSTFLNDLYQLVNVNSLIAYGLFSMNEKGCTPDFSNFKGLTVKGDFKGSRYDEFVKRTNGLAFPICDPFDQSLSQMAEDIVKKFAL